MCFVQGLAMSSSNFAQRHISLDSPCHIPLPACATVPMPCSCLSSSTNLSDCSPSLQFPSDFPVHLLPRPPADPAGHAAHIRQAHRSEVGDISRPPSSSSLPDASASSLASYPAPDPPTVLSAAASPAPFLSHAPPPPDTSIEVETSASAYRLNVRLPAFKRDAITLATKKRRILHIVADRWESGGGQYRRALVYGALVIFCSSGHFERRISFGYDADLVHVRAEFDGEVLRITVPRHLPLC